MSVEKLREEELCNFYSTNITGATKSRRMRWSRLVACMEERLNACVVLVANPKGKSHVKDLDVDGRIILHFMLKNGLIMKRRELDSSGSGRTNN
jgi:hypothetical protein